MKFDGNGLELFVDYTPW